MDQSGPVVKSAGVSRSRLVVRQHRASFNDFFHTGNTNGAPPAEAITLTGADAGFATSTIVTVVEMSTVTNNGTIGVFSEMVTGTLLDCGSTKGGATGVLTNQMIGGTRFTIVGTGGTGIPFGPAESIGVISGVIRASVVPEPASVILLGPDLVGTVGVASLRRFT